MYILCYIVLLFILYNHKHCEIKHIRNFLFFLFHLNRLNHSNSWPGAQVLYKKKEIGDKAEKEEVMKFQMLRGKVIRMKIGKLMDAIFGGKVSDDCCSSPRNDEMKSKHSALKSTMNE